MSQFNLNTRLNSLENNLQSLQQTLQQTIQEGLEKLSKQINKKSHVAFNHQYFILPENEDEEYRLIDEDHASHMIDGIIELYLNVEDKNSNISPALKEFSNIIACR